jgi:hypothetical protein
VGDQFRAIRNSGWFQRNLVAAVSFAGGVDHRGSDPPPASPEQSKLQELSSGRTVSKTRSNSHGADQALVFDGLTGFDDQIDVEQTVILAKANCGLDSGEIHSLIFIGC